MMVNLDERVGYLILGLFIGFVLGYIARYLQKIDRGVSRVHTAVTKSRKEDGIVRYPLVLDAILLAIVVMSVWGSFSTAATNHKLEENAKKDNAQQESISKVTFCNQQIMSDILVALNERTTYTKEQARANVDLQKGFLAFLRVLQFEPPKPESERRAAFDGYVKKLDNFVELSGKSSEKQSNYPFPTVDEMSECLDKPLSEIKKDPSYER